MTGVGKDCQPKHLLAIGPATQVTKNPWLTPQTHVAERILALSAGLVGYSAADFATIAQFGWLCSWRRAGAPLRDAPRNGHSVWRRRLVRATYPFIRAWFPGDA
jgi:hypothetical protein